MGLQLSFFTLGFLRKFALVLEPHVTFDFLRDCLKLTEPWLNLVVFLDLFSGIF